jgi:cyclic pyranopterin monophosphate synthase
MTKLTHLDDTGAAAMVDISAKAATVREAVAEGRIAMSAEALDAVRAGLVKKGDVLAVARVAGIMAAKKTSELIPLCHPLALSKVAIDFEFESCAIRVTAMARLTGQTGVEMEAITAASIALLTIYDMAKALDKSMVISGVRLLSKTGGKSGDWTANQ